MDMKTSPLATLNDPTLLKTDALINGEWVDPREVFTDSVVETWEETLYERCVESDADDRDYWIEEKAQQRRDDKLTGDA